MIEITLQLLIIVEDNEAKHPDKAIVCKTFILESIMALRMNDLLYVKSLLQQFVNISFKQNSFH